MFLASILGIGTNKTPFSVFIHNICALIFLTLVGTVSFSVTNVSAQEMSMQCDTIAKTELHEIFCDFQLSKNLSLEELTLTADGIVLEESEFTPYSGLGKTSAFLFLVDTSNPARSNTVKRNLEIVKDQMRFSSPSRLVGLATFANKLNIIYGLQETHNNVDATLNAIVADGAATEFFSSALEAIKVLGNVNTDRRALVIMSDGKAEDTAYNRNDVVSAAEMANVTIIGLGFAERRSETPALQEIRRLAEETGGYFNSVVANEPFEAGFLRNLPRYVENGGVIKALFNREEINGDVDIELVANTGSGIVLNASQTVTVEKLATAEEEVIEKLGFVESLYKPLDAIFPGSSSWAANNSALALIFLLLLPIALAALWLLIRRNSTNEENELDGVDVEEDTVSETELLSGFEDGELEADDATRAVITNVDASNGYFEVVGSESNTYPIKSHAISIGRHSDNDIRLSNDSVHRHHAQLSVSTDNVATIHDLDTVNGVVVNGSKIDKKVLQAGDVVEFGEVRLRYIK